MNFLIMCGVDGGFNVVGKRTGKVYFSGDHGACETWIQGADIRRKNRMRAKARQSRDNVMRDLGLVKVRGTLGGTYWE